MKKLNIILLFFVLTLFSSCGRVHKHAISTIEEKSFEDWREKIKLNLDAFESDAHNAYVDIYVNELAKEAYEKRLDLYPVGSEVFKPLYNDEERTRLARLVIMIKMQKGYDSKNGDWWYGVYDQTGRDAWHQGRIKHCIDCHALAKETDYMFSESVMDEIEVQKGLKQAEVYFE